MKKPTLPRHPHSADDRDAREDTEPDIAIGTIALGVALLAVLIAVVVTLARDAWVLIIALTQP